MKKLGAVSRKKSFQNELRVASDVMMILHLKLINWELKAIQNTF